VVSARRHALISTIRDGHTGLLASGDAALARHCVALLQDSQLAWRLGCQAHEYVTNAFGPAVVRAGWLELAQQIREGDAPMPLPPQTPWLHEQRWLRQLWGALLAIPGWPSWPSLKALIKRGLQGRDTAIGPAAVGLLTGLVALLIWALVVLAGKRGNDGQQFLSLALDPLQADPGTSAALDNPIYRGKRLLYPLLAWLLGFGQPGLILWMLGLINVACIGCAGGLVARWAQLHQRSPQWGLAVLALPGAWITLSLDTADLLATTLLLAAAVAAQQRRLAPLGASLTAALLTRETSLLAWAATGLTALWERRWRWLVPLALVPVPLLAWMVWLRHRFAAPADGTLASLHFSWPFTGVLLKAGQLLGLLQLPGVELGDPERLFDGLCFLLWLATLGLLAVAVGQRSTGRWLRFAAGCYLLPALCTSTQILARFPDYTRVWIDLSSLSLLVMLAGRSSILLPWLALSALVTCGYALAYSVLVP
jgi:hypothetical protein